MNETPNERIDEIQDTCPLTPALVELLQTCVRHGSATGSLAMILHRAPSTVDTEFKRINQILGTHSRTDAVVYALRRGWVRL